MTEINFSKEEYNCEHYLQIVILFTFQWPPPEFLLALIPVKYKCQGDTGVSNGMNYQKWFDRHFYVYCTTLKMLIPSQNFRFSDSNSYICKQ